MANKTPPDAYDRFLSRAVRTAAAGIGLGLVVFEALKGGNIEFALLGVGIAGLPFGNAMENLMEWIASLKPTPPEDR